MPAKVVLLLLYALLGVSKRRFSVSARTETFGTFFFTELLLLGSHLALRNVLWRKAAIS